MKRILSLILVLCMVFSLCCINAFAAQSNSILTSGNNGTGEIIVDPSLGNTAVYGNNKTSSTKSNTSSSSSTSNTSSRSTGDIVVDPNLGNNATYSNNTPSKSTGLVYTSLGDSASNGYGMEEYYLSGRTPDPRVYKYNKVIERAYPSMFSRAINAATFYQDCTAGLRSEDLLYLLDPQNYQGDAFTEHIFRENVMYELSKDGVKDFNDLSNRYIKHVSDADVITIDIGLNNFGEFLIKQSNMYRSGQSPYPVTLDTDATKLLNTPLFKSIKSAMLSIMAATNNPIGLVDVLIESLAYAYVDNLKCFDRIIDRIYELNPDVELYVLGLYDCFGGGLYLINDTIDIGKYNRSMMQKVNDHYKTYSNKYTYVDVIDVETFGLPHSVIGTDFMDKLGEDNSRLSHPNYNGHLYMYNQLAAKAKSNGRTLKDIFISDPNTNNSGSNLVLPFADVSTSDWFYEGVNYCYVNGITNGTSANLFSPNATVTRAQLATFIYRMAGVPSITNKSEPFADVPDSYWAHDAIAWAYNLGIIKGFTSTTFSPDSPVTRGQAVTMLCRYVGPISSSSSYMQFKDASGIPSDYQFAISWAVDNGIIKGFNDGTFRQSDPLSRAQMTVMMQRLCESK